MTDVVVDASVVLKWFRTEGEGHIEAARSLRAAFAVGRLMVHAPPLLRLEIVNIAARRWGWDEARLTDLAESLGELGITFTEPDPVAVARWAARGLTAYDAAYVALAEAESIRLVSDDARVLAVAASLTVALTSVDQLLLAPLNEAGAGEPAADRDA